MFSPCAEYACRHLGRVALLALGAAGTLALAAAVDVPPVRAVDPSTTGVFGGPRGEKALNPHEAVAGKRLAAVLDRVKDGQTVVWRNPDTRVTYRILPLATFQAGNRRCRAFTVRRTAGHSVHESYRTACRGTDGAWTLTAVPEVDPNG